MSGRITDFEKLLFEVRTVPVYADLGGEPREAPARLPSSPTLIPNKKAILNCDTNSVISVVSEGYQLVRHADAIEYGRQCCKQAFPDLSDCDWQVKRTDAPSTGSYCHVDLEHSSTTLDFDSVDASDKPDAYGPYIRVTNSYNLTRALSFDIGFQRKVCSNGMILPRSSLRFSLPHSTPRIPERISFHLEDPNFRKARKQFLRFLGPLRQAKVPTKHFRLIALRALTLREPRNGAGNAQWNRWRALQDELLTRQKKYTAELGENAYALLNVITDIASRPAEAKVPRRERHSLQKKAGTWLADFSRRCNDPQFDLAAYAKDCQEIVSRPPAAQPNDMLGPANRLPWAQ